MEAELTPGQIAWRQISVATKMSVGAREARVDGAELTFKVGKAMTWIKVKYHDNDTYTVRKIRVKRRPAFEQVIEEEHDNVYAEDLNAVIYRAVNK